MRLDHVPFHYPNGHSFWWFMKQRLHGEYPRWLRGPIYGGEMFVWEPDVPSERRHIQVWDIIKNDSTWIIETIARPTRVAVGKWRPPVWDKSTIQWTDSNKFRRACVRA